jgi:aryl sulfotransferase
MSVAEMPVTDASLPLFLASFPKSGNTWFRLLLANLKFRSAAPVRINSPFDRAAAFVTREEFDDLTLIASGLLTGDEVDSLRAAVLPAIASAASPFTWFKTHEAWRLTPSGTPCFAGAGRAAVYIVRDPRDVAVSLAYHGNVSIDHAIGFMNDPEATMARSGTRQSRQLRQKTCDWSTHVKSWLDQKDIPVYCVRYEDLKRDTAAVLTAALCFAGQEASREDIDRAVAHSDFSVLRKQEETVGFRERMSTTAPFFRRGQAGAWRDELTAEQCARIEAAHRQVMMRLGYMTEADPVR